MAPRGLSKQVHLRQDRLRLKCLRRQALLPFSLNPQPYGGSVLLIIGWEILPNSGVQYSPFCYLIEAIFSSTFYPVQEQAACRDSCTQLLLVHKVTGHSSHPCKCPLWWERLQSWDVISNPHQFLCLLEIHILESMQIIAYTMSFN